MKEDGWLSRSENFWLSIGMALIATPAAMAAAILLSRIMPLGAALAIGLGLLPIWAIVIWGVGVYTERRMAREMGE